MSRQELLSQTSKITLSAAAIMTAQREGGMIYTVDGHDIRAGVTYDIQLHGDYWLAKPHDKRAKGSSMTMRVG